MALVNNLCSWIRRYAGRFSCMKSANLQSYLNWFVYLFRVHRDEEKWPAEERSFAIWPYRKVSTCGNENTTTIDQKTTIKIFENYKGL